MSFLALPRDHERGREDMSIPITCIARRREKHSKRAAVRVELYRRDCTTCIRNIRYVSCYSKWDTTSMSLFPRFMR